MVKKITTMTLLAVLFLLTGCEQESSDFVEVDGAIYLADVDFKKLETPIQFDYMPVTDVIEVFWYGCPHCENFEPRLKQWLAGEVPENIRFGRIPAIWNAGMEEHAKAFYIARHFNLLETMHDRLFTRIISLRPERSLSKHKASIRDLFLSYGVPEKDYDSYYQSQELLQQVALSGAIMKASGVNSTPSFIVNGKYVLNPGSFKSPDLMLKVVNQLIVREAGRLPN